MHALVPTTSQCWLTNRSTGPIAACRHLGYKSQAQIPARHNWPVSSNVRPHILKSVPCHRPRIQNNGNALHLQKCKLSAKDRARLSLTFSKPCPTIVREYKTTETRCSCTIASCQKESLHRKHVKPRATNWTTGRRQEESRTEKLSSS